MKAVLPDDLRDLFSKAGYSNSWYQYVKAGDWLVLLLSGALVVLSYTLLWRGGVADRAIVKRDGQTIIEISLNSARKTSVEGPLGTTVIEVQPGRARVFFRPRSAPVLCAARLAHARRCCGYLCAESHHAAIEWP